MRAHDPDWGLILFVAVFAPLPAGYTVLFSLLQSVVWERRRSWFCVAYVSVKVCAFQIHPVAITDKITMVKLVSNWTFVAVLVKCLNYNITLLVRWGEGLWLHPNIKLFMLAWTYIEIRLNTPTKLVLAVIYSSLWPRLDYFTWRFILSRCTPTLAYLKARGGNLKLTSHTCMLTYQQSDESNGRTSPSFWHLCSPYNDVLQKLNYVQVPGWICLNHRSFIWINLNLN